MNQLIRQFGRESALAAATWIGALTGLFVAFRLSVAQQLRILRRENPSASEGEIQAIQTESFPVADGSVVGQYVDWLISYSTFDYGHTMSSGATVHETFFTALPKSLVLVTAVLIAVAVLAVPMLWLTATLEDSSKSNAVLALAYGLGIAPPLVSCVHLLAQSSQLGLPIRVDFRTPGELLPSIGLLATVAFFVAIPIAADAVRRVHRERTADDGIDGLSDVVGLARGGIGTLEVWAYVLYLASTLVAVEYVLASRGVGFIWLTALGDRDYATAFGLTAGVVFFLVFLGYQRNLTAALTTVLREDTAGDDDRVRRPARDVSTVVDTVARRPKTVIGLSWFAGTLLLGLGGSILLSGVPQSTVATRSAFGLAPGPVLNTVGALITIVLVAFTVAVLLGATGGLLASYLEGVREDVGGVLTTLLRLPADVWLVAPGALVVGTVAAVVGIESRIGTELLVGSTTGLVLAAFTFRGVYDAGRVRFGDDTAPVGAAAESLVAGLARTDGVAVTTAFVAGELAFLGVLPGATIPTFFDLDRSFTSQSVLVQNSPLPEVLPVLIACSVATGAVVLGVALIGDGLGEAAVELRTRGDGSSSELAPQPSTESKPPRVDENSRPSG